MAKKCLFPIRLYTWNRLIFPFRIRLAELESGIIIETFCSRLSVPLLSLAWNNKTKAAKKLQMWQWNELVVFRRWDYEMRLLMVIFRAMTEYNKTKRLCSEHLTSVGEHLLLANS